MRSLNPPPGASVFRSGAPSRAVPKQQVLRRPALGDMRHLITIQVRAIQPILDPDTVDFDMTFEPSTQVYAKITTIAGGELFDGVNLSTAYTHIFEIRYIATLDEEKWVDYDGRRYDIVLVETYDERGLFMKIKTNLRGDDTKAVNEGDG